MTPAVTVVIPTHNRARYVRDAIESVLGQTCRDFELIVVDDGSKDETARVVQAFGPRVRYVYQEERERAAARNQGIARAAGRYVAFLDSDDLWLPDHLEAGLEAFARAPEAGLVFSRWYLVDQSARILSKNKTPALTGDVLERLVAGFSAGACNASSCLVRKDVIDQAGRFNEDRALSGSEDWELWARVAGVARFATTGRYTVKIRFHDGKWSLNAERMSGSMQLALDTLFAHPTLGPRIKPLKRRAYSSLQTIIATQWYGAGDMGQARRHLRDAVVLDPPSLVRNPLISYTFLRSLLGARWSDSLRKAKLELQAAVSSARAGKP